jgi:hypothetical protein
VEKAVKLPGEGELVLSGSEQGDLVLPGGILHVPGNRPGIADNNSREMFKDRHGHGVFMGLDRQKGIPFRRMGQDVRKQIRRIGAPEVYVLKVLLHNFGPDERRGLPNRHRFPWGSWMVLAAI